MLRSICNAVRTHSI